MSTIRILPDQVANRIAAGEVIERPVAVVKELVDNSIDAGAEHIKVQFKQGGKSYILVEDDGSGMSSDDALLCIERHATSKIRSSDDLFNIRTLGFRGEAIPSIASVSRFLLRTRLQESLEGTEILINGGKLIHCKETGMPNGTRIEVTHLFSSIPARRKFLKTDNTEASHIIQWMRLIAIAHPRIAFRLQSNQRTLISVSQDDSLLNRILALWGKELEGQLLPIKFEADGIMASGYIGKAGVSRPARQDIVTIVNGRPVESRTLGFAFTEAYHTHIPKGRYPIVFLNMEIDPAMIDVNIHPSKKEVKFKYESRIRSLVIQRVWEVIRDGSSIAHSTSTATSVRSDPAHESEEKRPTEAAIPTTIRTALPVSRNPVHSIASSATPPDRHDQHPKARFEAPASRETSATSQVAIEKEWRFIGDYARSYSLFERKDGLTLIHNTRAGQRIRFENILASLESISSSVQQEIVPVSFEADIQLSGKLKKVIPLLAKCSIQVVEFGRNFYRIEEVPAFMDGEMARQFVMDWVREHEEPSGDLDRMKNRLALLSCGRAAGKLTLPLNREASFHMLRQLLQCRQPMVDPEGKPVIHHLPHRFFEKPGSLGSLT